MAWGGSRGVYELVRRRSDALKESSERLQALGKVMGAE